MPDSERDSCIEMTELRLHHGRSCTVRQEGTGCAVSYRMESTARDTERIQKRMQLFLPQFVRREWSAAPADEEQFVFVIVLLEMSL